MAKGQETPNMCFVLKHIMFIGVYTVPFLPKLFRLIRDFTVAIPLLDLLKFYVKYGKKFGWLCINPCHAEHFYVLHSPIFILLTCSIPVVSMYF